MSLLPLFSLPNSHQHCPVATTTQCCVPYCAGGRGGGNSGYTGGTHHAHKQRRRRERKRKGGRTATKSFFQALWEEKEKKGMTGPPARSVRQCYFCPERMDGRTSFFGPLSFFSDTLVVATTKSFWFVGEEVGGVFWYCKRWGGVRAGGCAAARRPPREGRTDGGGGGGTCCVCTGPWIWWAMLMIVGRRRVNEEVGREGGRKPSR